MAKKRGKQGQFLTYQPECSPSRPPPCVSIISSFHLLCVWTNMQCRKVWSRPFVAVGPTVRHGFNGKVQSCNELQIELASLVLGGQSKSMQRSLMRTDFCVKGQYTCSNKA